MQTAALITSSLGSCCRNLQGLRRSAERPVTARGSYGRSLVVRSNNKDFDSFLMENANKFEAAENKGAIVGWTLAAFSAITVAEWLIHLPLFDFLLGFPLQFLGLLTAVNLGMKYYYEKKGDPMEDLEQFVNKISKELPGL